MAGHIFDRWIKTTTDADGKTIRVKTDRYGTGMRYQARYLTPDGKRKNKSFPDGQKRIAEQWLSAMQADVARGDFIDPNASRTTFQEFAEKWLASQSGDPNTRASMESQLRLHAFPRIGSRQLGSFQPSHIRELVTQLEETGMSGAYARVIFSNVRAVLSAAVEDGCLRRNPCHSRTVTLPAMGARRVIPGSQSGSSPCAPPWSNGSGPWSTWAPDAACGKARSSGCASKTSTSTAAPCMWCSNSS